MSTATVISLSAPAAFWRELSSFYPDAKISLTVRDPERWYDSVRQTIFQLFGGGPESPLAEEALRRIPGIAKVHAVNRKLIWDGPLLQGRFEDRAFAVRAFEESHTSTSARSSGDEYERGWLRPLFPRIPPDSRIPGSIRFDRRLK
jgi:hypothetical protein